MLKVPIITPGNVNKGTIVAELGQHMFFYEQSLFVLLSHWKRRRQRPWFLHTEAALTLLAAPSLTETGASIHPYFFGVNSPAWGSGLGLLEPREACMRVFQRLSGACSSTWHSGELCGGTPHRHHPRGCRGLLPLQTSMILLEPWHSVFTMATCKHLQTSHYSDVNVGGSLMLHSQGICSSLSLVK